MNYFLYKQHISKNDVSFDIREFVFLDINVSDQYDKTVREKIITTISL